MACFCCSNKYLYFIIHYIHAADLWGLLLPANSYNLNTQSNKSTLSLYTIEIAHLLPKLDFSHIFETQGKINIHVFLNNCHFYQEKNAQHEAFVGTKKNIIKKTIL